MEFSKQEIEWIYRAIQNPERYKISIDNDCISIDEYIPSEDNYNSVFTFDNFGTDIIIQLFNYIGCSAEFV